MDSIAGRITLVIWLIFATVTTAQVSSSSDSFSCLTNAASQNIFDLAGSYTSKLFLKTAPSRVFDARNAVFQIRDFDSRWGMMDISGSDSNNCVAGGYVFNGNPWWAGWEDVYDTGDSTIHDGETRSNTPVDFQAPNPLVTGIHWFNTHDGPRFNSATGVWRLEHSWGDYTRDDCIENDRQASGVIYDTLFDGCYTGFSNRPGQGSSNTALNSDGTRRKVIFDKVLLRMELQPGPFRYCDSGRQQRYVGADGNDFDASKYGTCGGSDPLETKEIYGHGNLFKRTSTDRNPNYEFKDSVFLLPKRLTTGELDFPDASRVTACKNVTLIFLGGSANEYPGRLPTAKFPNCFTIVTGSAGVTFWQQKVADWHQRHPNVGRSRKPSNPGFPKWPARVANDGSTKGVPARDRPKPAR